MNLSRKTVTIVLALFLAALVAVFQFVPPDTTFDGYQVRGMVVSNDGTVHRFYEKEEE